MGSVGIERSMGLSAKGLDNVNSGRLAGSNFDAYHIVEALYFSGARLIRVPGVCDLSVAHLPG